MGASLNLTSNSVDALRCSLEITTAFSLEALDCDLSAVFDNLNVLLSDWEVRSLCLVVENLGVLGVLSVLFDA
jgi:hypothetical protein